MTIFSHDHGDTLTGELDGFTLKARTAHDGDHGQPWMEEDGHGPVREVRGQSDFHNGPSKRPGELVLQNERNWALLYDFTEACRIARKDGWGVSPPKLAYGRDDPNGESLAGWATYDQPRTGRPIRFTDAENFNKAIAAAYDDFKARHFPSAKAYAAHAARRDFERLRAWCNNDWHYVGVIVTAYRNGVELGSASLWGIEDDAEDYLAEVAEELAEEAVSEAKEKLAELCDCEEDA